MIEIGITGVAGSQRGLLIIDVELGIGWLVTLSKKQSSHFVIKCAMYPECVRPTTVEDGIVHINSDRCECKGRVILANAIPKLLSARG